MADESSSSSATSSQTQANIPEKSLERMEALLKQAAQGIHVLFDNASIANVMKGQLNERDFFDVAKMKKVQDQMTELVAKKTYFEKISYLEDLKQKDSEAYSMIVRTYFHIVENTARTESGLQ